jgi:hypothetical protein
MPEVGGGRLCGKIRFTANTEPVFVGVCHCRSCQRNSGSAFAVVLGFPAAAVSMQGELKTYTDTGDSGKSLYRRCCPECGSSISSEVEVMPGMILPKAGALDDPSALKPGVQNLLRQRAALGFTRRGHENLPEDAGIADASHRIPDGVSKGQSCRDTLTQPYSAAARVVAR